MNSWFNEWSGQIDKANPPVQAVEFTPDKMRDANLATPVIEEGIGAR